MADPQNTTLAEVAGIAGVSASTVSRFINGSTRIDPAKVKAIEKAIKRLNYRPNLMARGLASGRTMTVGVMTQEMMSSYFSEAMRGVDEELSRYRYAPIFVNGHWDPDEETKRLDLLLSRGVDGLILILGSIEDGDLARIAQQVPTVMLGRQSTSSKVYSITADHYAGAVRATQHLIDLGHRNIAFISGPKGRADAEDRLRGYRETLHEAGIPFQPALVAPGDYVEAGGLSAMETLLGSGVPFTAVFAANDDSAFGARLALYRRGIAVPQQVSIVGFDDLAHSAFSTPPMTSVRQPAQDLGRQAARAVVSLIDGQRPTETDVPALDLIVRESSCAPPNQAQAYKA